MSGEVLQKTIVLVEDNPANMELATDLLELAGFRVVQATTAESAITLARREQPSLVLMDLQLPGMDGLEATRRLKGDPETSHIPVVALTASVMKGHEWVAIEAGCIGYVSKPIDTRSFARVVTGFIEQGTAQA